MTEHHEEQLRSALQTKANDFEPPSDLWDTIEQRTTDMQDVSDPEGPPFSELIEPGSPSTTDIPGRPDGSRYASWWVAGAVAATAAALFVFALVNWPGSDSAEQAQVATSTPDAEVATTAPEDLAAAVSEATTVITYGASNRPLGEIEVFSDSAAFDQAVAGLRSPAEIQEVNFDDQVVVSVTVVGDGCYREFIEFRETEPGILTPHFDDTSRTCIQPAINWTTLLAIDRNYIDEGFTLRIPPVEGNNPESRREITGMEPTDDTDDSQRDLALTVSAATEELALTNSSGRPLGDIGVAQTASEYDNLLGSVTLSTEAPEVNFAEQLVVAVTVPGGVGGPTGGCDETRFSEFQETEPGVLTPQFEETQTAESNGCYLPSFGWTTLLTIDRNAIGTGFTLRLADDAGSYEESRQLIVNDLRDEQDAAPADWIWEPTHAAPTNVSVSSGTFATTDNYYFAIGGMDSDGTVAIGYTLNFADGRWLAIDNFGFDGQEDLTAVAVGDDFVVVGGWTPGTGSGPAIAKFSPITREWTSLGELPAAAPRVETISAVGSRPNHLGVVVDEYGSEDRSNSDRIARTFFEFSLETGEVVTTSPLPSRDTSLLLTPASDSDSLMIVESTGPDVVQPALGSISVYEIRLGQPETTPALVTQVDGVEPVSVAQLRPGELVVQEPTNILFVSLIAGSTESAPADTLQDDACRGGMAHAPSGVVAWDCFYNVLEVDGESFGVRASLSPASDEQVISPGHANASPTGNRIVFREVDESGTTLLRPTSRQN